jgi:hypothetical protein
MPQEVSLFQRAYEARNSKTRLVSVEAANVNSSSQNEILPVTGDIVDIDFNGVNSALEMVVEAAPAVGKIIPVAAITTAIIYGKGAKKRTGELKLESVELREKTKEVRTENRELRKKTEGMISDDLFSELDELAKSR